MSESKTICARCGSEMHQVRNKSGVEFPICGKCGKIGGQTYLEQDKWISAYPMMSVWIPLRKTVWERKP